MPDSSLSVLIVNWNTRALLARCLDSVIRTVSPPPEIIVVDNGSTDDSVAFLRAHYPSVQVLANASNLGFAAANNQALTTCRGQQALLLNSDAELQPGAVASLQSALEQESRAAAAGPMLLNADASFQAGPNDEITLWSESLLAIGLSRFLRGGVYPGHTAQAPSGTYAWVGGTCLLLRRVAWEQVGLLDAAFFMYVEEADWCWRARQAGWRILYVSDARVLHLGGGTSRRAPAAMRAELYKSKLLFFIKHRPRWQAATLRAVLLGTAMLKTLLYTFAARARPHTTYADRAASFRRVYQAVRALS